MKVWRIVTVLLLSLVLVGAISCDPLGESEPATELLAEVIRGDLTVTVSGSGNLEVSNEATLTFGAAGRIDKIHVQEGDEVSKGQLLAGLETDTLELAVTQAQVAESQAQVAITQAQLEQSQTELAVTQAELAVTQAQLAVTQAQLAVETAEYDLEQAQDLYAKPDILRARTAVNDARSYLQYAQEQREQATTTYDFGLWTSEVAYAEDQLRAAEVALDIMLSAPDTEEVAITRLQVAAAEQSLEATQESLEAAQRSLETVEQSLDLSGQSLELTRQSLELAKQSRQLAEKQLDEATITAPFDGLVANVHADEGDTIPSPSMGPKIILHLIDPSSMEVSVEVDEIDVTEVKLGQRAIIELDALPDQQLEGKVSSIGLLSKVEGGVTVYDVEIDFDVPEGLGIRVGMSATADIIVAERSNVLLVPDRAVKKDSQGNTIVEIKVNDQYEERVVVTGVSDGFQAEIVDGLEAGETVVERRARP